MDATVDFFLSAIGAVAHGARVIPKLCVDAAQRLGLDEDRWRLNGMVSGPIALVYMHSALSSSDDTLKREIRRVILIFAVLLAWIIGLGLCIEFSGS